MTRLLIVEDDADVREVLSEQLTNAGFDVSAVGSGADAVVAVVEETFDLVLLDIFMPGFDGIQTIRVLRKVQPDLPILGLTGYVGQGYMAQAASYGVTCLAKPIEIGELVDEIRAALRK